MPTLEQQERPPPKSGTKQRPKCSPAQENHFSAAKAGRR